MIVISDASIRNNVVTLILYIHSYNRLVSKMIHHVANITTTEAKLFTIRCEINQAISILNIKHIVIITDVKIEGCRLSCSLFSFDLFFIFLFLELWS